MKFSLFINNKAAAAINATDMGSKPDMAAFTYILFLNLAKKYEINKTSRNEGRQTANVARIAPQTFPVTV